MNQHRHRLVFNVRRGLLMAVAETAHAQGKATGESGPGDRRAPRHATPYTGRWRRCWPCSARKRPWRRRRWAQIVAYRNAPGSQRPTVLNAGNGVPLVNIQTPSGAGVSHNTYSQFDVHDKGAILNNSRKGADSQLAGPVRRQPLAGARHRPGNSQRSRFQQPQPAARRHRDRRRQGRSGHRQPRRHRRQRQRLHQRQPCHADHRQDRP